MDSDEQNIDKIITGCREGNRKAQEQLYRSYYRAMMSLCLRYTKTETDALEVLNTGFYKVFKHIDRFDAAQASLYTWIRTVIVNSCLDFIKTKQRRIETSEPGGGADIAIAPDILAKISAGELLNLVHQLPPATQAVFNLYTMEGYAHAEIGQLLGISEGTSKWHLSEARKKLQQLIRQYDLK